MSRETDYDQAEGRVRTGSMAEEVTRRAFIRLATSGSAATAALFFEACGTALPIVPKPTANPVPKSASAGPYPTYLPTQGGPTPDFASIGPLYEDAFKQFPSSSAKAWTKAAPGAGGTVQALGVVTRPALPNALDQNPAWQEINKQLNVNFQLNRPPPADYNSKLATIMAGNDLPDIICFRYGPNFTPASLPQFLEKSMADLTPYLGGDAARDYPFLAALPTFTWKNGGCAYNGKLYMVPAVTPVLGNGFFRNVNIYDQEIGANYRPSNADDFKRVLQTLTRPADNRWGIGTYQGVAFNIPMYAAMFGAPNNWQLDASGKLVKDRETAQYREAVGYVRDLYAAGVFHPDSLITTDNTAAGTAFTAGKWVILVQGFAGTWQQQWFRGLALNPPNTFMPLGPFPAHDGQKPAVYLGPGVSITTGLKKASEPRVKELLGVLDWLAAPFGSQEDLLLTFGAAGVDWKPDADGHPVPTDKSNADAAAVNWKNIVQHPSVAYAVGLPDFAKATFDAEHELFPLAVDDPTLGLVSATDNSRGFALNNAFNDGITDIMAARRSMSDYDQLVKDWQSGGGDTIRVEYQQAIAAQR
jgi:putative aldouronate transport system substrate-binding protein